jgi:hypothetical protein
MRHTYVYRIHDISPTGMATVEYETEALGSITRVFVVPHDRGEDQIRRKVVEMFPLDLFYSRHLTRFHTPKPEHFVIGSMTIDFDDHFYDVQEMTTGEATRT